MRDVNSLFVASQSVGELPAVNRIFTPEGVGVCQSGEEVGVRNLRLSGISDSERELHITACARLMEMAMLRWHETGNFADRGEADRWRLLMEEAIKGRSPATVARMEQERGLA